MCIRDSTESVQWTYEQDIVKAVAQAKQDGHHIVGIEQTNKSIPLPDYQLPTDKHLMVIMGNEVNGISEEVLPLLDVAIEIPQYGTKHSLNVAVCAGIIMWSIRRSFG